MSGSTSHVCVRFWWRRLALGACIVSGLISGIISGPISEGGIRDAQAADAAPLGLRRDATPIADLHGEPQVQPECIDASLRIAPCQPVSEALFNQINANAQCFVDAYAAATGASELVSDAELGCHSGIQSERTTRSGGLWSQHRFRRACDGSQISVNGKRFSYHRAVAAARKGYGSSKDLIFFEVFLDCWGPSGPGVDPAGQLVVDDNLGVRDWREDPARHSDHYHLSAPCLTCGIMGSMAYE